MIVHPVVLCGGAGTRLWPSSRKAYPKQFANIFGEYSLYQDTLQRLSLKNMAAPTVMTSEDYRFLAVEQAEQLGLSDARVVVEPLARDTGPAILAAAILLEDSPEAIMLVTPSDHAITKPEEFHAALIEGMSAASDGAIVTFGVVPDRPETGYGYLKLAERSTGKSAVIEFTEKPDAQTALEMLGSGNYLWNSGIFMGRVCDFLTAYEIHAPEMIMPVRAAVANASFDLSFTRLAHEGFAEARAVSIDYAIMELADNVVSVPLDCGWSDLGAWDAVWNATKKDPKGNVTAGDVKLIGCEGSYLRSEDSNILMVGLGLKDTVAVALRDAILVADKSRSQDLKLVVETLRTDGKGQADEYPRVHRPWGWYETLCFDTRFQVKRIMVRPGGVLSLQSHRHRSEHWIVVAGTAEVTIGDNVKLVTENEGVYIPLGERHRLANPGKVSVYLIEVQTGAYLGEDDIVRYDDIYHRT